MKHKTLTFLLVLTFYACSFDQGKVSTKKPDLEMEVINAILPQLIPKESPCMLVPMEGEGKEAYDQRLQNLHREVDSVGKKIEIVGSLTKLDNISIIVYNQPKFKTFFQNLLNAPEEDRNIDSTLIDEIKDHQIILVKKSRSTIGGWTDCYTLGQFSFSRVGFNKNSTQAAFTYRMDDGSCTGGKSGLIEVELKKGKWQIKK